MTWHGKYHFSMYSFQTHLNMRQSCKYSRYEYLLLDVILFLVTIAALVFGTIYALCRYGVLIFCKRVTFHLLINYVFINLFQAIFVPQK